MTARRYPKLLVDRNHNDIGNAFANAENETNSGQEWYGDTIIK